jgi:hypothetical protein
MPSPSKIKGSGFEREVAKYLSDRYGESFIRNISGSGAYVGGVNSVRKNTLSEAQIRQSKGDIVPPESFPYFNAEAKFYGDFAFHQLFSSCQLLETWINQLMTVADADDVNLLFMKFNRKGRFIAVQVNLPWINDGLPYAYYRSSKHGDWMIYSFESFFEKNTDLLKSLCGTKPKLS